MKAWMEPCSTGGPYSFPPPLNKVQLQDLAHCDMQATWAVLHYELSVTMTTHFSSATLA